MNLAGGWEGNRFQCFTNQLTNHNKSAAIKTEIPGKAMKGQ